MTFKDENDPVVKAAVERILALRRLTAETGVKTYKSQSAILETLQPQVLAAVALILTDKGNANDHTNARR
jgi:hypothetical protein